MNTHKKANEIKKRVERIYNFTQKSHAISQMLRHIPYKTFRCTHWMGARYTGDERASYTNTHQIDNMFLSTGKTFSSEANS